MAANNGVWGCSKNIALICLAVIIFIVAVVVFCLRCVKFNVSLTCVSILFLFLLRHIFLTLDLYLIHATLFLMPITALPL